MTTTTELMSAAEILAGLVAALASGRIRVVDLTQTLTPEFPQIALPPEMGQCWPFRIEEVSALRRARTGLVLEQLLLRRAHGHALRCADPLDLRPRPAEQLGRHDPVQHFVAPACVIDCSEQVKATTTTC